MERLHAYRQNPIELKSQARTYIKDKERRLVSRFQENVLLGTERDHPSDFEEVVQDMMQEGRYWPIILGTHKSHPAGFPLIEESHYLSTIINPILPENEHIKGSLLLIANTMHKGQSDDVVKGLRLAEPIFKKFNTEPLPVLRKKDAKGLTNDEKTDYQKKLFGKLGRVVESGQIPIVLPEATVESGRQKPGGVKGDIKGMVYLEPGSVAFLSQMIKRQKKEPLFFFVGTTGENRIYDPITETVTRDAKVKAIGRGIPGGKQILSPIMKSVVDYPTPLSAIEEAYGENGRISGDVLEWVCGERLAQLLPYNERGVFTEPELLDMAPQILRRDTKNIF